MFEIKSPEYLARIQETMLAAILKASTIQDAQGRKTAVVLTGEVIDACISPIAMLAATSKDVARSPTSTRQFADQIAKKLRGRIAAVKLEDLNFITVVNADDRH
jgi:hypothetical protein